jgi:hypothetical protein
MKANSQSQRLDCVGTACDRSCSGLLWETGLRLKQLPAKSPAATMSSSTRLKERTGRIAVSAKRLQKPHEWCLVNRRYASLKSSNTSLQLASEKLRA